MSRAILSTVALCAVLTASQVLAEHAKINLDVMTPTDQKTAHVDQTPPASGKNPRPVIKAKVNDRIKIEWMFTNDYPNKTIENVVVHFFIVRQEKVGQKELPDLQDDVVLESAFDMDFKPGGKAGQRHTLKIDKPGVYLIRVESRETQSDHEHFAAIDLVIEGEKPELETMSTRLKRGILLWKTPPGRRQRRPRLRDSFRWHTAVTVTSLSSPRSFPNPGDRRGSGREP